jgi:hypothetical protein
VVDVVDQLLGAELQDPVVDMLVVLLAAVQMDMLVEAVVVPVVLELMV